MKIKFITGALVDGKEILPGDVADVSDDVAQGYIERGSAHEDGVENTQSDALIKTMQPHVVDQALINTGDQPTEAPSASEAPAADSPLVSTPPASDSGQNLNQPVVDPAQIPQPVATGTQPTPEQVSQALAAVEQSGQNNSQQI